MPMTDTEAPPEKGLDHDIQDRLTAILNAAHIIRLACSDDDPLVASALRIIEQSVDHLTRLAGELASAED